MQKISLTIALVALLISLFNLFRAKEKTEIKEEIVINHSDEESHEVVDKMMTLQWLTNKLYFAGSARNSDLTEFYFHELEEKMEEFAEAEIVDEGLQLSVLMRAHGLAALDLARTKTKEQGFDAFGDIYSNLISGCNNCHSGTGHAYIKIAIPTTPVADNQDFK